MQQPFILIHSNSMIVFSGIIALLNFAEVVSGVSPIFNHYKKDDITAWKQICGYFFAELSSMKLHLPEPQAGIQVFLLSFYESGISKVEIIMTNPREFVKGSHFVDCSKSSIVYHYTNGFQVVSTGRLLALLNQSLKIVSFEYESREHTVYVPRKASNNQIAEGVDCIQEIMLATLKDRLTGPRLASGVNDIPIREEVLPYDLEGKHNNNVPLTPGTTDGHQSISTTPIIDSSNTSTPTATPISMNGSPAISEATIKRANVSNSSSPAMKKRKTNKKPKKTN
ncbi:12799_t:CDS:2 [Entrophospora sp. SA101]|nr:9221_t:CDS:2 [Entrophospora sp. SA101]CAJ0765569.1 12799_t:CDS:2 [Entrophospora sp. SA101]